ncbi:hypothetical protein Tco_0074420, partial [Tanacetum coccineum]
KSKKIVFQSILDKIKKKLGGWKEKTLSIAGKEVLIKSVAQAMPMSLLAKQVWRLITFPSTLSASFVAVKDLVHMGCKWNVGDGRTVNVWEDFWLADHKKLGPKPHNTEVYYVRDLLNNEGNDWDYEKLTSLFPPYIE